MYLGAEFEEAAEAHEERAPTFRIDMRACAIVEDEFLMDVELLNVDLEDIGIDILAEGPAMRHASFHLHGTLSDAGRSDRIGGHWG